MGKPVVCGARSTHRTVAPELFYGSIDMRCGNMRAQTVKRRELLFEGGQHALRVRIARRGR